MVLVELCTERVKFFLLIQNNNWRETIEDFPINCAPSYRIKPSKHKQNPKWPRIIWQIKYELRSIFGLVIDEMRTIRKLQKQNYAKSEDFDYFIH